MQNCCVISGANKNAHVKAKPGTQSKTFAPWRTNPLACNLSSWQNFANFRSSLVKDPCYPPRSKIAQHSPREAQPDPHRIRVQKVQCSSGCWHTTTNGKLVTESKTEVQDFTDSDLTCNAHTANERNKAGETAHNSKTVGPFSQPANAAKQNWDETPGKMRNITWVGIKIVIFQSSSTCEARKENQAHHFLCIEPQG